MEAVRDLTSQYAKVPRATKQQVIGAENLVVEDVVIWDLVISYLPI
jgi:hypothetical protein